METKVNEIVLEFESIRGKIISVSGGINKDRSLRVLIEAGNQQRMFSVMPIMKSGLRMDATQFDELKGSVGKRVEIGSSYIILL